MASSTTKRILVVGGGIGGTMTANNLVTKFYPEILSGEIELGRSQELTRLCSQELTRRMRSDLYSILDI